MKEEIEMSISLEYAQEHANDPAVLCCRAEEGTTLTHHNLEDPAIFPDLVDGGLLSLDGALTIGQVLNGSTLTKTADSLTPVTADIVDKFDEVGAADAADEAEETPASEEAPAVQAAQAVSGAAVQVSGGVLKLSIKEGKDIYIELPL
jgi:D-proline reductase (dithiol) PrdA